jgi:peptide/nickel transport system permease protein
VGFWVIIALFADNCLISPRCYAGIAQGDDISVWVNTDSYQSWLSRYSPLEQFSGARLQGPSWEHWLGTDSRARDIWARLAHGSRSILTLAPISVIVALVVGGTLGLVAGYFGGLVDEITMRILDAIISFPQILLYLVIISAFGASAANVVIAITIAGAPGIARLVRGLTLDIRTRDFIAAAETRGEPPWYIMFIEILPNARGPIIIDSMLRMGYAVFSIGTLGFLGLGLPPPSPDWGSIVQAGRNSIQAGQPWEALFGSIAIAMVVVGLNLMADGLSEESQRYR